MDRWLRELQQQLRPEALLALLAALPALGLLAAYLYLLKPALAEYRELATQRSHEALEDASARAPLTAQAIVSLERELETLRDQLYGGSSTIPLPEVESWVIQRLDGISRRHAVELVSVAPGRADRVLSFDELPFDVRVSGRYHALFAWLHDVEDELRPMAVKSFEMRGEASATVALDLRLVSYRAQAGST